MMRWHFRGCGAVGSGEHVVKEGVAHRAKRRSEFVGGKQIEDREFQFCQKQIGCFGPEFTGPLQQIVDLRLRDSDQAGKTTLGEFSVIDLVINEPYEASLKCGKTQSFLA